jgi:hypothetical protein
MSNMNLKLSRPLAAAALVALAALGTGAQARDNVYWSLGVQAAPGVSIGVGNARPVYVAPPPVYVQPHPVYVTPAPVYIARPVIVRPAPVMYVQPAPVYYGHPGKHRGWHKHKNKHRQHRDWD